MCSMDRSIYFAFRISQIQKCRGKLTRDGTSTERNIKGNSYKQRHKFVTLHTSFGLLGVCKDRFVSRL